MDAVDNNQFEIIPVSNKRKVTNVYLNPALDLLANEDPMCNNAMEIVPIKKRKRSRSCDIAVFENSALDLGISKAAVNEFLVRELKNVCDKNLRSKIAQETSTDIKNDTIPDINEPIYSNVTISDENKPVEENQTEYTNNNEHIENVVLENNEIDSILEHKSLKTPVINSKACNDSLSVTNTTNILTNITNQVFINNTGNLNLSFIDRLALDSPNISNQTLYLDDDLNESNIMEIKSLTFITTNKQVFKNTNPFLDSSTCVSDTTETNNPFLPDLPKPELEYSEEAMDQPKMQAPIANLMPRRLFAGDSNSTISTMNESLMNIENEYENIDSYRAESPIYENAEEIETNYNKQSKILGHDVKNFSAVDIMNLNKNSKSNVSNDSNDSKRDLKHHILKASNKLSKKVIKTLRKTFKTDKVEHNVTLNPYEVPRKLPKPKIEHKDSGIENPALNLDQSDEMDLDLDDEHQYETIKTLRNTQLNMNVTPLKECTADEFSHNKSNTPNKKVRFDSTLNQEKVITGNSFDCGVQSPGFDAKIDKYHDELENCINERKILEQNM